MNSKKHLFYNLIISCVLLFGIQHGTYSQCDIEASAYPETIYCGQEAILTAFGSGDGTVMLDEDFDGGAFGPGWSSTPGAVMWNNPCSPGGVDGTTHAWMGNNTTVPRDIVTTNYDLSGATAGVTICFDLLFASQGDAAPCEGPDEPDEGVYLQYSTDGGATWITIHYFDPNGGNDPQLTNWNNWCFPIPGAAITPNTQFRWHQDNDSGQDYDHWGIDNVEIIQNDVNATVEWGNPGDSYYHNYGVGSPGGENPNHVSPTTTTTYTVSITTGSGDVCTDQVTVTVIDPVYDVDLTVNPTPICVGNCADITGNVAQVIDPGGIETYENSETSVVTGTPANPIPIIGGPGTIKADMNINIQTLNNPTVQSGQILSVCLTGFNITPGIGCSSTSLADIKIILECPDGTQIILADVGDLTGNTISDMCFEPGGANIASGSSPYTGTFAPKEPFSGLNGCSSNGQWAMRIRGDNNETCVPLGSISGWNITFDDPPILNDVDYTWSPTTNLTGPTSGSATQTINNQACPPSTTTYNLTVSNGVPGCATHIEPVEIIVDPCTGCTPPTLNINALEACSPNTVDLNGAIDPSSDPANNTFYNTQNDADNATNPISNSVTTGGSYWVRAEDLNDPTCFNVYEIQVNIVTVTYSSSNTDPTCGNNDGEIDLTASGGNASYTYSIDGGATTQSNGTFSGLGAGTYNILITDNNGCEASGTETLNNSGSSDDPSFTLTDFCEGTANSANVTGTPGGTFTIVAPTGDGASIDGSTGEITNGVGGTTYTVEYTTNGTCPDSQTQDVTVNASPTFTTSTTDPSCGNSDGEIVITPDGGFTITDYSIDNGATTQSNGTFSGLGAGTYNILITDNNGCEASGTETLNNSGSSDDPSFTLTDFCEGTANSANVTGTPGGTFTIVAPTGDGASIDGSTGEITNGVGGTTYTIEYTTSGTCPDSETHDVTVNASPTFTTSTTDPSCGNSDGEIVITPDGGFTITDYSIDNGATTQSGGTFSTLTAGTYNIVITDNNGCEATGMETLTNTGSTDDPSFTVTDFCAGTPNSANVTGTPGGTFTIVAPTGDGASIDGTTGEITNGVSGTTYTIEYATSGACPASETHDVTVFSVPTFTTTTTDPSCGNNDGEIIITVTSSGALVNTYSIDNGTTTQSNGTFSNIGAGTYNIIITDNNGCEATGTESLSNAGGPTVDNINTTDPSCTDDDGEIEVAVSGGAIPLTYQWYDENNNPIGTNSNTINNLSSGDYSVEITDDNGCMASGNATLNASTAGDDASFALTDFCEGTTNSATITGTPGGTFTIITPTGDGASIDASTGEISNGVGGTTYTVEYTTNGTCPDTQTQDVTVNASPTFTTPSNSDPTCGNNDGSIEIVPDAGFTITDYSIDGGATTQSGATFTNLGANTYNILIIDNNGCEGTGTVSLSNAAGPTIDNVTSTDASCSADDGTITVTASGGATPLNYELDNGQTSTSGVFTGVADGNYTVTVTDFNGCVTTQTVTVGKASGPTLTIASSTNISCFGADDGSAEVSANGGTGTYTYSWSPSGGTAATATDLPPGTYTVTVTDGGGCSDDVQITITEPNAITVNETITPSDCGLDNGEIDLTVTGGSGNYTYAWDPGVSATNQATDLAVGAYEVIITDDNGCSETMTYNVSQGNSFYVEVIPEDTVTIQQGESVNINLFVDPNVTVDNISWFPPDGLSCTDCKDPVATPDNSTTYIVAVTDENGCVSTDTVQIKVILPCAEIFVPNTFSPNGDGLNDLQCVLGECIVSLDFTIFNRWGETVFKTKDQEECWNGMFRGKRVQSGTYVYKLKATLEDGTEVERTGNVTVVW